MDSTLFEKPHHDCQQCANYYNIIMILLQQKNTINVNETNINSKNKISKSGNTTSIVDSLNSKDIKCNIDYHNYINKLKPLNNDFIDKTLKLTIYDTFTVLFEYCFTLQSYEINKNKEHEEHEEDEDDEDEDDEDDEEDEDGEDEDEDEDEDEEDDEYNIININRIPFYSEEEKYRKVYKYKDGKWQLVKWDDFKNIINRIIDKYILPIFSEWQDEYSRRINDDGDEYFKYFEKYHNKISNISEIGYTKIKDNLCIHLRKLNNN